MSLVYYMFLMFLCKLPMYLLIILISLILSGFIDNVGINILISIGLYMITNFELLFNNITKYLFIYNWDISKYVFGNIEILNKNINTPIIISLIWLTLMTVILFISFKRKDIINE